MLNQYGISDHHCIGFNNHIFTEHIQFAEILLYIYKTVLIRDQYRFYKLSPLMY